MRGALRTSVALVAVLLLLAGGCSDDESDVTAGAVPSSSTAPVSTSAVALSSTTSPPTSAVPEPPAVVEAGGWRLVVKAPTRGVTIGPALDLCYELTGPGSADVALDVSLILAATGTTTSLVRVAASVGTGSARVNLGSPEPRFYDLNVQGLANGQPIDKLAVRVGVRFASAPPAGCP